jgi:triphosphoribosyl-dephospho-CoA synthetase
MATPVKRTFAPLAGLRRWLRSWWDRQAAWRQSDQRDERDLQRVLHDLNMTRSELDDAVTRGAYPRLLLPEMIQALGLNHERIKAEHRSVDADLRRMCAQCSEVERCRHELDAQTAATNFRKFCNNSATLDALLAEAAREAKSRDPDEPED